MDKMRSVIWWVVIIAVIGFIALNLPSKTDDGADASLVSPMAGFTKGTHFELIDHHGDVFNSDENIPDGDYGLLFFGFTHCPVICPTELQKFAAIMDLLPPEVADKVHPLFITIDPERDTPKDLADYVPLFHPSITGLTGDVDVVHKVLVDWNVYYAKVEDPQYDGYTMDHSTYSYLVDHDMNIVALYKMQTTEQDIAANIQSIVVQ